ncbi:hypothetical protein KSP40_PGU004565 [Platanthera guangdongensis]|uniref:Ubiquitin-like protease family profile domain-containing protein n=1 Tax=Platanthera guangdongensis TaxID=2320717 RepID=A0ABR2N5P6_9ASPA
MSTHLGNHWALFVSILWESKWYFYDSYRNPTHRETLTSLTFSANKIDWEKCQDWQRMMPKFRAELANEMIRTFYDGCSKGLVQHEDSSSKGGCPG